MSLCGHQRIMYTCNYGIPCKETVHLPPSTLRDEVGQNLRHVKHSTFDYAGSGDSEAPALGLRMAGVFHWRAAQVCNSCSQFVPASSSAHRACTFLLCTSNRFGRSGGTKPSSQKGVARISRARRELLSYWNFSCKGEGWKSDSLARKSRGLRTATVMAAVTREPVGPGQESVWDYPRPPALEKVQEKIKIVFNGETIAETTDAYRVLETSHPPVYYIPSTDVAMEHLSKTTGSSHCEWKGSATWWNVLVGSKTAENAGWSYESPTEAFLPVKGYLAFYADPMDACYVGEEQAKPQPGNFYGGWMTSKIVGPVKGESGSWGW